MDFKVIELVDWNFVKLTILALLYHDKCPALMNVPYLLSRNNVILTYNLHDFHQFTNERNESQFASIKDPALQMSLLLMEVICSQGYKKISCSFQLSMKF